MLLLLDLVPRYTHNVIVFQSKVHRLLEGDVAMNGRFGFLAALNVIEGVRAE